MSVDLAKYVVALEVQNRQYMQGLETANRRLDRFQKQQERAVDQIKSSFLSIGKTLVAAFSVRAIVQFTASSIRMADAIAKTARAAAVSAEQLQRLRFAFSDLGGIEAPQTDASLMRFNKTLGDAIAGSKAARDNFAALGVAIRDSSGGAVSTQYALDNTLKSLADITSGAERAARASALFGRELGPKMAAALNGGIKALEQAKAAAAGVITDPTVRQAEALGDAWERISSAVGSAARSFAVMATYDLARTLGVDEAQYSALSLQEKINELRATRNLAPAGADPVWWQAQTDKEIAALEQRLRIERQIAEIDTWGQPLSAMNQYRDGLQEITDLFVKMPADLKKFDWGAAIRATAPIDPKALLEQNRAAYGLGEGSFQMLPDMAGLEKRNELMMEAENSLTEHIEEQNRIRVESEKWAQNEILAFREGTASVAAGLLRVLGEEHRGAAIAAIAIEKALAIKRVLIEGTAAAGRVKALYDVAAAAHMAATAGLGGIKAAALRAQGVAGAASIMTQSRVSAAMIGVEGVIQASRLSDDGPAALRGTSANPISTSSSSSVSAATSAVSNRRQRVVELHIHGNYYGTGGAQQIAQDLRDLVDGTDFVLVSRFSRNGMDLVSS